MAATDFIKEKPIFGWGKEEIGYLFHSAFYFWAVINRFEAYQNFWTSVFYYNLFMSGVVGKVWLAKL